MKIKSYIILIVLFLLYGCHDDKLKSFPLVSNDSIVKYLEYADDDSVLLQKRLDYNNRAFEILKRNNNDSLTRASLIKVANRYFNNQDLSQYKKASLYIIEKSKEAEDSITLAKSYYYLGDYYAISDADSALYYYSKSEKIYRNSNFPTQLSRVLLNMARLKSVAGDYLGSEVLITRGLTVIRSFDEPKMMFEGYNMLGNISVETKNYDEAKLYYGKALEVTENFFSKDDFYFRAVVLNNIGNVYIFEKSYQKAKYEFQTGLRDTTLFRTDPELFATLLNNIAYTDIKLNNFENLPESFYKSFRIRDSLNLHSAAISSLTNLSEYYSVVGDTANAIRMSEVALQRARAHKNKVDLVVSLKQAINVNAKKASIYSKEYMLVRDTLQNLERQQRDKFARIQFETDEISFQKDALEEQNRNLLSFFIGTIMIILLLFVIRTQRAKNRELLLRQAQQKANEDIYNLMLTQQNKIEEGRIKEKKKIAQELHDGVLGRLFGARLNLDSLNRIEGSEAEIKRNNYLSELKSIEQDIREISHDLNREKSALINNFVAIFNNLIEQQSSSYTPKITCFISSEIPWDKISNNLKINMYRITQEALQNINKYANASEIDVKITESENVIDLSISDNGIGFDIIKKSKGIGLQNINSRAQQCDGKVDLQSFRGKGTTIKLSFPIILSDEKQDKQKNHNKKWSVISTS